ncbi:hypothetical protein ACFVT5_01705 [Streptomyces sp. NPDC058001]|uniref:hypothetical protein n=1 Tax=Streptomyces sp. NPDC058001 TaxID=3346300 RepID=UPI0036E5240C
MANWRARTMVPVTVLALGLTAVACGSEGGADDSTGSKGSAGSAASKGSAASAASADTTASADTAAKAEAKCEAKSDAGEDITDAVVKLEAKGLTERQIDARLAKDYCVERVDTGAGADEIVTMGNPSDEITLYRPKIYKVLKKWEYIATATWKWKKIPGNVKGRDGFAITFNNKVTLIDHSLWYAGREFYKQKTMTQAESSGAYGVGFTFNEGPKLVSKVDMQGYKGGMSVRFKASKSGCWNVQTYSKYGHSWKSSSMTGISLGKSSIGFSWSNNSNKWQQASQGSKEAKVCR